jgi:hypothetical protein
MNRRGMLGTILAAGFAPAIAKSGILMPLNKRIIGVAALSVPVDIYATIKVTDDEKVAAMSAFITAECRKAIQNLVRADYSYNSMANIENYSKEIGATIKAYVDGNTMRYDVLTPTRSGRIQIVVDTPDVTPHSAARMHMTENNINVPLF